MTSIAAPSAFAVFAGSALTQHVSGVYPEGELWGYGYPGVEASRLTDAQSRNDAIDTPTFVAAGTGFDGAVRQAAAFSAKLPLSGGNPVGANGSQAVAVVQAADGAYALTPLIDPFPVFMYTASARTFLEGAGVNKDTTREFTRLHDAIRAVVGTDQWADLRSVPVGGSARTVDLPSRA